MTPPTIHLTAGPVAPTARNTLFFPVVATPPAPQPAPSDRDCFGDAAALAFFRLLVGDARQQRPALRCYPPLVRAARRRAATAP